MSINSLDILNIARTRHIDVRPPYFIPSKTNRGKLFLGVNSGIQPEIDKHIRGTSLLIDYYRKVFGWIPANPNKQHLVDAIARTYKRSNIEDESAKYIVNTEQGHDFFLKQLYKQGNPETIFIVGPKGCGKTFYLNYLFNLYTRDLYEHGFIWYRAELSKLYRKNNRIMRDRQAGITTEKPYSFLRYLFVHIAYVSFKYRNENPVFKGLWDIAKPDLNKLSASVFNKNSHAEYNKHTTADSIAETFLAFINRCMEEEEQQPDNMDLMQEHIESIFNDNNIFSNFEIIGHVVLEYLQNNGIKPLFVIDGLDNVNFFSDFDLYKSLLKEVRSFCQNGEKKNRYNAKFIVALRDETLEDMKINHNQWFTSQNKVIFSVKVTNPFEIISHKVQEAINPSCRYFKNALSDAMDDLVVDEDDDKDELLNFYNSELELHYTHLLDNFWNAFRSVLGDFKKHNDEALFAYFYNFNLRQLLNNFINTYLYMILITEKKPRVKRPEDSIHLFVEGQLLNGYLWLDTQDKPYDFGKCIPNIFYFDANHELSQWHGLVLLRILQLLKTNRIPKKRLIELLCRLFNYDKDVLEDRFYFALSHGLISCSVPSSRQNIALYFCTEKGSHIIEYIFRDVTILYYLSLDTPLSLYANDTSSLIRFHENSFRNGFWVDYIESAVLSSLTLVRHIITQHDFEIDALPENTNALLSSHEANDVFSLPSDFLISYSEKASLLANLLLKSTDRQSRHRYYELEKDLNGIV